MQSTGKSPFWLVRSLIPCAQPELRTCSPVSWSRTIRSPFRKLRNVDSSPAVGTRRKQLKKILKRWTRNDPTFKCFRFIWIRSKAKDTRGVVHRVETNHRLLQETETKIGQTELHFTAKRLFWNRNENKYKCLSEWESFYFKYFPFQKVSPWFH